MGRDPKNPRFQFVPISNRVLEMEFGTYVPCIKITGISFCIKHVVCIVWV